QQLQPGIAPGLRPEAVKTCENHCMNSHQAHGADSATTSATVLDRLSPRGRLVGLDVARGIALLAMMATHIFALGDETGMPTWAAAAVLMGLCRGSISSRLAVILAKYGVMFALALFFLRLRASTLFVLAGVWMVLSPVVSMIVRSEFGLEPGYLPLSWFDLA